MTYPRTRAIFIDVDGTLLINGKCNTELIEWIIKRKSDGFTITLWSARGQTYSENVASSFCIEYLFDHIISKPGYVVDDMMGKWSKYIKVVNYPKILQ